MRNPIPQHPAERLLVIAERRVELKHAATMMKALVSSALLDLDRCERHPNSGEFSEAADALRAAQRVSLGEGENR